jgi:hypothetical protein
VVNLPLRETALGRALGAVTPGWSSTEELLAAIVEQVDLSNRLFVMAHSKKGTRPPTPITITRPGQAIEKPKLATPDEVRSFFGGTRPPAAPVATS